MTRWRFEPLYLLRVESIFPNLKSEGYQPTSATEPCYNCLAWAAGDTNRYWSPVPGERDPSRTVELYEEYWPPCVPPENTLEAWSKALATAGFTPCATPYPEDGFEKLAIYLDEARVPQHVARQLPNGKWTSKLGDDLDLEHNSLRALEGDCYGSATAFMKRRISRVRS